MRLGLMRFSLPDENDPLGPAAGEISDWAPYARKMARRQIISCPISFLLVPPASGPPLHFR